MHYRDDLSCKRGYEFWLLQEARKRNPDIKTYALSWALPWYNHYISPFFFTLCVRMGTHTPSPLFFWQHSRQHADEAVLPLYRRWVGNQTGYYSDDEIAYHIKWMECTKEWDIGEIDYMGAWNERCVFRS